MPHRRCCLAGTCRWFKASGPLGSCWLWPRKLCSSGLSPTWESVGLDLAPVPLERVEAHAAGHPLSGAIHAAFLPMQGVCVAPAPRCQRLWKHRGACQPSLAVVLERPRAAPAGSPGAGNLAQAPGDDVPQPAWPSGLFRAVPRLARLPWATSLTCTFEGAGRARSGWRGCRVPEKSILMPTNDSAPAGQGLWAEGGSQGG